MHSKTAEFLNSLLYFAEILTKPTVRNLTDSYETWADRKGLLRRAAFLERHRLLERDFRSPKSPVYRLTDLGRLQALGGRDPGVRWSRSWDGRWRLVVFDVPLGQNAIREKLRRGLKARAFGCLQQSVWITPDIIRSDREILADGSIGPERLILLEARVCAGERDCEIVSAAWDFKRINLGFEQYLRVVERFPACSIPTVQSATRLRRWAAEEWEAWLHAVSLDPLLPERLLPAGYLGREAWRQKSKVLSRAAEQLKRVQRI